MSRGRLLTVLTVLAALALAVFWSGHLTGARAEADAAQNLRAAWNLVRHGVVSIDETDHPRPDMFREPLPILIDAAAITVIEAVQGPAPYEAWDHGARLRLLKGVNLLWLALLGLAVWGGARTLGGSRIAAAGAVALTGLFAFAVRSAFVDTLGTDLAGAALLASAAVLAARAWRSGRRRLWIATGVALGLAALTKSSLLYVAVGLAAALALLTLVRLRGRARDPVLFGLFLMLAAGALVAEPWSARNRSLFGEGALTDRGGEVLLIRAYLDLATPAERRGAWCAFAPGKLREVVCPLFGHRPSDIRGGRSLERFNRAAETPAVKAAAEAGQGPSPESGFYRTAKARYRVLLERFEREGHPAPRTAADDAARAEAVAIIRAHPGAHLAMTPVFLWRGLAGLTVLLGLAALAALARRRDEIAVFLLPFVGLGAFMALFTHFIPRYGWPMVPAACVIAVLAAEALVRRLPGRAG